MSEQVVAKRGLGLRFWIILVIVILLVIGASAGAVYYYVRPLLNPELVQTKVLPTHKVLLDPFTVNLKDSNYRRYIRTEITLETNQKKVVGELTEKDYRIRDKVIGILSKKNVSDLSDKEALKHELIGAINEDLVNGEVVGIYFEEFMIQ